MIKVLFCGLKYEYGRPAQGLSFEYQNFYGSLKQMAGVQLEGFFIDEQLLASGRDLMNQNLITAVEQSRPDLLFCFLFTEELKKQTIAYITQRTSTKTFNWFADDHWRFPIFSKYWAQLFTLVGTTDSRAVSKYRRLGARVIHTQWAANPELFFPRLVSGPDYQITFVGQNYATRQRYLTALNRAALPAQAFGTGWPAGRIAKEQAAVIWSNSAINLNFTESNYYGLKSWIKLAAKLFIRKELGKYKFDGHHFFGNLQSSFNVGRRQIKSRNFEIPACGGFLLTGDADNLREYYRDGKEIVIFHNNHDLVEKCRYYLAHTRERAQIAEAGLQRTRKEHTYAHRFQEIFRALDLPG